MNKRSFFQEPTFLNNYAKTGVVGLVVWAVCHQLRPPAGLHGGAVPDVALEARHRPLWHAQQARDKNWNIENGEISQFVQVSVDNSFGSDLGFFS